MDEISIIFAKIAALKKNFDSLNFGSSNRIIGNCVESLFPLYFDAIEKLKQKLPELYSDIPDIPLPSSRDVASIGGTAKQYYRIEIDPLIRNLNYVLELRANYRIGEKIENQNRPNRIFISHGQSTEWYKVQSFIEKDIQLKTLELAQEPSIGRTVLQKLNDEANRCGYAVIVMTGDDIVGDQKRARENVMHEIGFFQGKYGLQNVTLLHEEGVNIPSNIHGLVYIPFPKDTLEATFGALFRELKAQIS